MFTRLGAKPQSQAQLDRVEALVRDRFGLGAEALVMVSETPTRAPGMPPVETTVRIWTDSATRYRLRLFVPAARVGAGDLPARWLLPSLIDDTDTECC